MKDVMQVAIVIITELYCKLNNVYYTEEKRNVHMIANNIRNTTKVNIAKTYTDKQ